MPKKYPKLRGRTKKLAGQYIAEEVATRRYPLKVARAIGISRAKSEVTILIRFTHSTMSIGKQND